MNKVTIIRGEIMKKILILITLLIPLLPMIICGQENLSHPLKAGIVKLEFWGERNFKTGTLTGIYPTIIQELSKRLNIEIGQHLAPYPRVMLGLKSGQFDLTITLPDNDTTLIVGEKVWTIRLGVLSRRDKPVRSSEQLKGMRVGIIRAARFEPNFDVDTTIHKIESVQHRNLLNMLEIGRIDAIASDLTILNGLIIKRGKSKKDYAEQLIINELPLHVIFSSKSSYLHLKEKVNATITEMIRDGEIENIIFKYLQ